MPGRLNWQAPHSVAPHTSLSALLAHKLQRASRARAFAHMLHLHGIADAPNGMAGEWQVHLANFWVYGVRRMAGCNQPPYLIWGGFGVKDGLAGGTSHRADSAPARAPVLGNALG